MPYPSILNYDMIKENQYQRGHKMETVRKKISGTQRKELILNAACCLFAENGYEKTTTKQIALAAKCSEALIYKYFESKKTIMDTLLEEWVLAQKRKIKLEVIDHSALATLRRHYESFISCSSEEASDPALRKNLIKALHSAPYYQQKATTAFMDGSDMIHDTIVPIIQLGQQLGEIKKDDPVIIANLFVSYMIGAREITRNFPNRFKPVSFDVLVRTIFQ